MGFVYICKIELFPSSSLSVVVKLSSQFSLSYSKHFHSLEKITTQNVCTSAKKSVEISSSSTFIVLCGIKISLHLKLELNWIKLISETTTKKNVRRNFNSTESFMNDNWIKDIIKMMARYEWNFCCCCIFFSHEIFTASTCDSKFQFSYIDTLKSRCSLVSHYWFNWVN